MAALHLSQGYNIQKIAIVDDDRDDAGIPESEVEAAGFEPLVLRQSFHRIEDMAAFIKSEAQGALCTHRLSHYGFARFYGAKLVAALYDMKVPAVLITQYTDIDQDVSIRRWREKIPVVLSHDEAYCDTIRGGLQDCLAELQGHFAETRVPYRVLLRIKGISDEGSERVVDVIIPGWNPRRAVRLPVSLIPKELHMHLLPDEWLFAYVNIGAEKSDDLYFRDFEFAPEPDDDDGLA